jgi:hypothetical protein
MARTDGSSDEIMFFPYRFLLDKVERWLLWQSGGGDPDAVVADDSGSVPTFHSREELQRYAARREIAVQPDDDPAFHDLDVVARWLRDPRAEEVDSVQFLLGWNLFWDVATTLGRSLRFRDPKGSKVYDRLFWGNNLPAVTPEECHYEPTWTASDLLRMRQVLSRGLQWFREATAIGV